MEKDIKDRENDFVFKEYKKYKKKKPLPDFSTVIDFQHPENYGNLLKKIELTSHNDHFRYCQIGLKNPKDWKVYELTSSPGFLVIPNPFLHAGAQSHWVKMALTKYTKKPYPSNLDILMSLNNEEKTLWDISHEKSKDNTFINKLRWVHMGYHFDYNVVDYKEKQYFGFPNDLAILTETIAAVFQFPDYLAETGIINFYPEGASMGGHTDHYEDELCQPLISYSFGQSAVYLIGGPTRDIKPEAIWVRSGDIMLMTGQSRIAFHAVPCIITKPSQTTPNNIGKCPLVLEDEIVGGNSNICNCEEDCEHVWKNEMLDPSWKEFSKYISNTRININIRQVHKYQRKIVNES